MNGSVEADRKRLVIVDVSSFIFRAFYAIRPLHAPDKTPINAVHGVLSMMLKLFDDFRPTHILVARDLPGPCFRADIYPEYKGNRSAPPEDLIPQFPLIETLLGHLGLVSLAVPKMEADDVIGSVIIQWKDSFDEILVATGDKDLMQFVDDKVHLVDTKLAKAYDSNGVFEKMGVRPDQIIDYLSLLGDASDNIPGARGIGAKGASKLLAEYGTLEEILKLRDKVANKRVKNSLIENEDKILLSKELVTVVTNLPLGKNPEDTLYSFSPTEELISFLKGLGFKAQVAKLSPLVGKEQKMSLVASDKVAATNKVSGRVFPVLTSAHWEKAKKSLFEAKKIAVMPLYHRGVGPCPELLSLALTGDGQEVFLLSFPSSEEQEPIPCSSISGKTVLQDLWTGVGAPIIGCSLKQDLLYLLDKEILPKRSYFDLGLAHYLLDFSSRHDLEFLAENFLQWELPKAELKRDQQNWAEVLADKARAIFALHGPLEKDLRGHSLEKVYYPIDNPLCEVLGAMELEGVAVDRTYLEKLAEEFSKETVIIEKEIQAETNTEVNLKSPKQVSALLFETLELPVIKKIKTGASTDSSVLEELSNRNLSPIPRKILRYRELDKLLSTYVLALPKLIDSTTGRLHTSFNATVTATGRLSSDRPNLQNIPVRTLDGLRVRQAFYAPKGSQFFSADYSQVELRLLAHFSEDPVMVEAFLKDDDIHRQTASEILGVPLEKVNKEERTKAKAVNFGLLYGQSSFGLARNLRISRNEARDYILKYFSRFKGVKAYLDSLKDLCEEKGYAETLFGRRRYLPDIRSENRTIKAQAERLAVNTPIQGTAADIIKVAMIQIYQKIREQNLKSRLILQIHDELIFEVPEKEKTVLSSLVVEEMSRAADLRVPLKVDTSWGSRWSELK